LDGGFARCSHVHGALHEHDAYRHRADMLLFWDQRAPADKFCVEFSRIHEVTAGRSDSYPSTSYAKISARKRWSGGLPDILVVAALNSTQQGITSAPCPQVAATASDMWPGCDFQIKYSVATRGSGPDGGPGPDACPPRYDFLLISGTHLTLR
jgi:hypothetical protein